MTSRQSRFSLAAFVSSVVVLLSCALTGQTPAPPPAAPPAAGAPGAAAPAAMPPMAPPADAKAPGAMAPAPAAVAPSPMSSDLVAPMVAFLAHEACPVSGEIYAAGAGRFSRIFIASTPGYVHAGPQPTIEDIAQNWATINDETGYYVPADLTAWSAAFMAHLPPTGPGPAAS